jgi:hydroxyacylglutathione hydrolase
MRELAPGIHQLRGSPPNMINVYLAGDVLVDAGTPGSRRRILRQLRAHRVGAHVVTHAHPDHFGSSHAVCESLGVALWTGSGDASAVESATPVAAPGVLGSLLARTKMPHAHPVSRTLREGDDVGDLEVLEVPGHSPGHIALWRESDRTLICGDVFFNFPRLGPPPGFMTVDPRRNLESMRRLADLRPALVLFGHGPPLRDPDRLLAVATAASGRRPAARE